MAAKRNPDPADAAFRRYVQTGDPGALAEVFDRTAAELHRLAHHLGSSAADADDLLQDTFLTAIEKAATFRTTHPVRPWLCGILANHARALRRARRRAAAAVVSPDQVAGTESAERHAHHREALLRIDGAIDGLAEPYRSVVALHLREQLSPGEIAVQQNHSPATVRSRLMRGLAHLRRGLPAGLAGSLAALLLPRRGIAAVRHEVLRAAERAAGTATVAAAGRASLGIGRRAVCSLLVALTTGAVVLTVTGWSDGTRNAQRAADPTAAAPQVQATDGPSSRREAAGRRAAPVEQGTPAPDTTRQHRITGQLVRADDGGPLDEPCSVRLCSTSAIVGRATSASIDASTLDLEIVPDPDGHFRFDFTPHPDHGGYLLQCAPSHPRLVRRVLSFPAVPPGGTTDLGALPMHLGGRIEGTLRDGTGAPLDGRLELCCESTPRFVEVVDGRFRSAPLPLGTWPTRLLGFGPAALGLAPLTVTVGCPTPLELTVEAGPTLRGRVIDGRGAPLARALVTAGGVRTWSEENGAFTLRTAEPETSPSAVVLHAFASGHVPASSGGPVAWPSEGTVLRLQPGPALTLRVRDRQGNAVDSFTATAIPVPRPTFDPTPSLSLAKSLYEVELVAPGVQDTAGDTVLRGLWPGINRVSVIPGAPDLAAATFFVDLSGIEHACRDVVLGPSPTLAVTVRDSARRPVPGVEVELLAWHAPVRDPQMRYREATAWTDEVHDPRPLRIGHGRTDASGVVALAAHGLERPNREVGTLRVHHPDGASTCHPMSGGAGPVDIELPATGSLTLDVELGLGRRVVGLLLSHAATGGERRLRLPDRLGMGGSTRLRVQGLERGTWLARVEVAAIEERPGSWREHLVTLPRVLARCNVARDRVATAQVQVEERRDTARLRLATVHATAPPAPGGAFHIDGECGDQRWCSGPHVLDPETGAVDLDGLPPGRCRIRPDDGRPPGPWIALPPGGRIRHELRTTD